MNTYFYSVYGITLCSELELPELAQIKITKPDVSIRFGCVPEHLPFIRGSGVLYEAAFNDFLFKFENIGRFRVQNGTQITIQPAREVLPEDLRLFLLGSNIGAILHQRGMLAIHGSSVTDGYNSAILSGKSGVGKSTLAAGLLELGYSVIADDISVISYLNNQKIIVEKGIPQLKLWKDVLAQLNESKELNKVRPQLEKYRKPIPVSSKDSNNLSKIVILSCSNAANFSSSEIIGKEKFHKLRNNTYRLQFIDGLKQTEAHFRNLSKLASSVKMYQVDRPYSPLRIIEFARFVSENVLKN